MQALALLQAELGGEEQTPEAGFMTRKQWGEAWGTSDTHTARLLQKGITIGKVERKNFRIRIGSVTRPTPHYRVVI